MRWRWAPASMLVALGLHAPASAARAVAVPDLERTAAAIVALSNDQRRRQGRAPLRPQPALAATAQAFADHLARHDRFAHDADGRRPAQRATARGYRWCMVAENIGWQFSSAGFETQALARSLVDGWMRSPGHRRNLLAPQAREIGVGLARSAASGRYYAVQMVGRSGADCAQRSPAGRPS